MLWWNARPNNNMYMVIQIFSGSTHSFFHPLFIRMTYTELFRTSDLWLHKKVKIFYIFLQRIKAAPLFLLLLPVYDLLWSRFYPTPKWPIGLYTFYNATIIAASCHPASRINAIASPIPTHCSNDNRGTGMIGRCLPYCACDLCSYFFMTVRYKYSFHSIQ